MNSVVDIPVAKRAQNKVVGDFYPLQKAELMALRKAKLINNAAYVHFALRSENPFCDRPVEIKPKEFALRWQIPEVSVYKAIAKLKDLCILAIKAGKLLIEWVVKPKYETSTQEAESATGATAESAASSSAVDELSEPKKNYQNRKTIIKFDNELSEPKKNYQNRKNCEPKPPSDIESEIPQTLQNYTDFKKTLSEGERENFLNFVREQIQNLERPINDLEAWLASKNAANQNRWEVYYENYQKQGKGQKSRNTQQGNGEENFDRQRAIAEFRKRMKLDRPINESEPETEPQEFNSNEPELKTEPEKTNSCQSQWQRAEFDELLDNSLGIQKKSPAQRRREQIAEARQQRQELNQKIKEAADERAKQLDPDLEKRKAAMLRQVAEFQQRQQHTPPETNSPHPETDVEDN